MKTKIEWYARGGGIAKCGPFKSQVEAVDAMRLADRYGTFPNDIFVWPEMKYLPKKPRSKKK